MIIRKAMIYGLAIVMMTVAPLSIPLSATADTLSNLQKKSQQLKQEADKLQKQISSQEKSLTDQKTYKATLDKKIANSIQQIDLLDEQIDKIDAQISSLNSDVKTKESLIQEKEKTMANEYEALQAKLRALSKTGNMSKMQMLLSTDEYADYLIKSKMIERQAQNTEALIKKIEAELIEINRQKEQSENDKAVVQKQRETVAALKFEADKQKKDLDVLYQKSNVALKQLQKNINAYSQDLKATKEEQDAIEREIAKIISNNSSNTRYTGGTMFWPVPTVRNISSYFGPRWGTTHRGIDIANGSVPIYGQSVVAAASGKVIYANSTNSWGGGYGYYIIIDHGRDSKGRTISTLYAHNSKVLVSVGQTVVGGQTVISKAGSTGDVTGPHLHFEVRVNGKAVDPIANGYLKA